MHSLRAREARRDWLQQFRLANNRDVHVRHYANDAARVVQVLHKIVLLFYFIANGQAA